ncbi:MAG TPA: S8 family peptidase [Croceibacterium sp.]|nr:S8 family peptidase [Croceibacterium sp.]
MPPISRSKRRSLSRYTLALSLGLLGACGGGGGGYGSIGGPTPSPTPAPTSGMPPRETVIPAFDTPEFRRSDGPADHNAASAWSQGRTGSGVTIAIVDTGIDEDSPEFAGRISSLSRDILNAGRPLTGTDDHGTHVALVAAGARNASGIVGIAYDAKILALRADAIGSCTAGASPNIGPDCYFDDRDTTAAINYASANGAKIINLSLGGNGATMNLQNAARSAVDAGALIVVSAGNGGSANPDSFATLLAQAAAGGAIIVGSVDENGRISDDSNRAGTQAALFLAARGEGVCCAYANGQVYVDSNGYNYLLSGTSFAAPQVSGAAALLAQAYPHLTGRQIADILLRSAYDAGAPGTDPIYGRGILDIARAFQPLGATSLAGLRTRMAMGDATGIGSGAMGDALSAASLPTLVADDYDRVFEADLAAGLNGAQVAGRLRGAVETGQRHVSLASGETIMAFSVDARGMELPESFAMAGGARPDERSARVLAGRVAGELSQGTQFGFAYGQSAASLAAVLQRQDGPAFLIAPDASGESGVLRGEGVSIALRRQLGPWGLLLNAERGETLTGTVMQREGEQFGRRVSGATTSYGVALDRRLGDVRAALGLTWTDEEETLLGGRFHDSFGLTGTDTVFFDARAGWNLASGWRVGAALRQGWTFAPTGGLIAPGASIISRAWSVDLERQGLLSADDRLALRLSQPLRVESGALNLMLPVSYSYDTLQAELGQRSLGLAPQGRELLTELAWRGALLNGYAAGSLFYRRDPGHYEAIPADRGVALTWSRGF